MPSDPKELVDALLSESLITPKMAAFIASDKYIRDQQAGFPEFATESYIAEQEKLWMDFFRKNPKHGISTGSYGYYPRNLAKGSWMATDGATVNVASIADLMFTYGGGDSLIDFLNAEPGESHLVLPPASGRVADQMSSQERYELGQMRGDHR
jgi:hypothetical protein